MSRKAKQSGETSSPIVRFSVNLSEKDAAIVKKTAEKQGKSYTAVLDRALKMAEVVDTAQDAGGKIVSVRKNGQKTTMKFIG